MSSGESLKRGGGLSRDVGVAVVFGDRAAAIQSLPGLFDVARRASFDHHECPREIVLGAEALGAGSPSQFVRAREAGFGLVIAAEHCGEPTDVVADWREGACADASKLIGEWSQSIDECGGDCSIPAGNCHLGVQAQSGEPGAGAW